MNSYNCDPPYSLPHIPMPVRHTLRPPYLPPGTVAGIYILGSFKGAKTILTNAIVFKGAKKIYGI
jgi:hypothetical protein